MIKNFARSAIARLGYSVAPHHDLSECAELLNSLHPMQATAPLIRVGHENDGGYVVPDDFDGVAALLSPGVSTTADFEFELAERGMTCHLADGSVTGPPIAHDRFTFTRRHIGLLDNDATITLDTWAASHCEPTGDLVMQMDIEGAEWAVLANASAQLLDRFRIMAIEFHDVHRLLDCPIRRAVLWRLLTNHAVVHNHPNNWGPIVRRGDLALPMVLELTFVRRDRLFALEPATTFPHPLDRPNLPSKPDLPLPQCWYTKAA